MIESALSSRKILSCVYPVIKFHCMGKIFTVLRTRILDQVLFIPLNPKSGSGIFIRRSGLVSTSGVKKIIEFFVADPDTGSGILSRFDPRSGMEKFGSGMSQNCQNSWDPDTNAWRTNGSGRPKSTDPGTLQLRSASSGSDLRNLSSPTTEKYPELGTAHISFTPPTQPLYFRIRPLKPAPWRKSQIKKFKW